MTAVHAAIRDFARRVDLERRRLEAAALAALAALLARVKTHARAAYRLGHDSGQAVRDTLAGNGIVSGLGPTLAKVALAASLAARQRVSREARRQADVDATVLATVLVLTRDQQAAAIASYERQLTPYINGLADRVAAKVRGSIGEAIQAGVPVESAIAAALAVSGVGAESKSNPDGPWAVRQLAEWTVGVGYADGQAAVLRVPEVAVKLTAYTYCTREDSNVRPFHATLDGMTRPADDPVWLTVTPPTWEHQGVPQYNCRCWRVPQWGDAVIFTDIPPGL